MNTKVDYVFCHPGNPSSAVQSIRCEMIRAELMGKGKSVGITHAASSNIYAVRNACLNKAGGYRKDQKPFEGTYDDYKFIIWVDSDNMITLEQVERLISHDVDIVAGWYLQQKQNGTPITSCGCWSGRQKDRHVIPESAIMTFPRNDKGLIEVDFAGFGLMVMKKGVLELIDYPWFRSWVFEWDEDGVPMADMMTEDTGLLLRLKEKGFHVFVDPEVRIGHEKKMVI